MVCIVKHHEGPVTVAATGAFDFYYKHSPDRPPTMIDMVTGELVTGTGALATLYYIDGSGVFHRIARQQLTIDYPFITHGLHFLMVGGEMLKLRISGLAAADTVQWSVNGH